MRRLFLQRPYNILQAHHYDYSWSTWMKNSIAIGEAGVSSDHGSVGQAYRFATKGNSGSRGTRRVYVLFHNFIAILVESRYFLVAVLRSAVDVIVRGHYQQIGALLRGLRLFRRAVLDLRRHDRQLLIAPSLLEAGRERH